METKRVLSSLSYFSVLFAGFIFPLVVFFVSEDSFTKGHAKRAFLSHLIPFIPTPLLAISFYYDITSGTDHFPIYTISCVALMAIIGITILIWNIVRGVKVLKNTD